MATGQNSIAAGETAIAQGNNSVAIGENIFASGQNACALGQGATQTIYLSGAANATQYTLTELQTFDSYATLSNQRVNADGSISSSPPLSGTQYA
jgi:autotransporter adhesin